MADFVMELINVKVPKKHPYTLIFEGYIPDGTHDKLYTIEYNGEIVKMDAPMTEKAKENFQKQLRKIYEPGYKFDKKEVKKKLKEKSHFVMKG